MSAIEIHVTQQGDYFVPDVTSAPIASGNTITFYADPDTQTNLCMTAETAAILSPTPDLTVAIAPGDSKSFTMGSPGSGPYCILTQGPDWPYPNSIGCGDGGSSLSIVPGKPPIYTGPDDDPKT